MSATVRLLVADGDPVPALVSSVELRDGVAYAAFDLALPAWERAEAMELLWTDADRLRTPPKRFESARPVRVEAVLDPIASTGLRDPEELEARLARGAADDPVVEADSWWALSATQEVELPPDLADEGQLWEGQAYVDPPWLSAGASVGADGLARGFDATGAAPLLDLFAALLDEGGWSYERPDPDVTILQVPVESDNGELTLWVRTDERGETATVYAVLPVEVPDDRIAVALELAARLNESVPVGSFEADADTGRVSFKVGIDVEGDRLSVPLARQLLGCALVHGDAALPLVADVAAGSATAWEAAARLGS